MRISKSGTFCKVVHAFRMETHLHFTGQAAGLHSPHER
jgi:hypothetical protein